MDYEELITKYDNEIIVMKASAIEKIEKVLDMLKDMKKFTEDEKKQISDIKIK